jgi:TorA maturation chaperone TorD
VTAVTAAGPEADIARALSRAAIYRVLGIALGYPAPGHLEEMARTARTVGAGTGRLPAGCRDALQALAVEALAADPAELAGEYVSLFDRQVRCSPHEGAYVPLPPLAGKPPLLVDIAGFHAAFGLAPSTVQPDMEDHIVAELEFMSALAMREAWALANGPVGALAVTRAAARAFLGDHLGRWAGAFAGALAAATTAPCYACVAALLEQWIRIEVAALGVTPGAVSGPPARDLQGDETLTCPMDSTGK